MVTAASATLPPELVSDPPRPRPKAGILQIEPYVGGRSKVDGVASPLKLSSNENVLGCSPLAAEAFSASAGQLHLYPDGRCSALRAALARRFELEPDRLIFGCGSDEIFTLLAQAYCEAGDNVIQGQYGFLAYRIAACSAGAEVRFVAEPNLMVEVDAILKAVDERTRLVYLANPANPTGTCIDRQAVARLHQGLPPSVILVLDGAYAEFASGDYEEGFALASGSANVVVTRTFSKIHGLAALRVGWGYGPLEIIDAMERIRGPFNVNLPAQNAALAALQDEDFVRRSQAHVALWRPWLTDKLADLGLPATASQANFVTIRIGPDHDAGAAETFLASRGILVRGLGAYGLKEHLRITIGEEAGNRAVVEALSQFLAR